MTAAAFTVRVAEYGLETRPRHDGNGFDVYDLTKEDRHSREPSLIGHIVPAGEGHEATRASGELESVVFGKVSECLAWLAEPLSERWPHRLDHDLDWLHAIVGQMNERRSLGQAEHIVRLTEDVARTAARIRATAQAIALSDGG